MNEVGDNENDDGLGFDNVDDVSDAEFEDGHSDHISGGSDDLAHSDDDDS